MNFGIIGCGRISAKFADAVSMADDATLYAVASSDKIRSKEFADRFYAQHNYTGYDELINNKEIDVIYIGLTNNLHYEVAKKCLIAKKNVVCEKPLTLSAEDTKSLIDIAKENNVFFMEAMWTRFLPAYNKAKQWYCEGKIGKARILEATMAFHNTFDKESRLFNKELGGGALYDLGVYCIDFITGILGKNPEKTQYSGSFGETDVDESSTILMEFEDGQIATATCSIRVRTPIKAYIYGENGYIFVEHFSAARNCFLYDNNDNIIDEFHDKIENGFYYQVMHIMEMLKENRMESDKMPFSDTLYCAELIDKCLKDNKKQ